MDCEQAVLNDLMGKELQALKQCAGQPYRPLTVDEQIEALREND